MRVQHKRKSAAHVGDLGPRASMVVFPPHILEGGYTVVQGRVMAMFARAKAISWGLLNDPVELSLTAWSKYGERPERRKPRYDYQPDPDWERKLHSALTVAFPCTTSSELDPLWPDVLSMLTGQGVAPGPASYGGWNDGDPALIRAIWCLTRHLRAAKVVETGVGHGVTSRFILEALQRNSNGRLWSIDLPTQLNPELHYQIGMCVGDNYRDRWSFIRGSSRRRLPTLLRQIGKIDLFIHDSRHSEFNVIFELKEAWKALRPGGAIVVDDIDLNWGFHVFTEMVPGHWAIACESEPITPDVRRFNKKGLFGILLKRTESQQPAE
jgi:Methyltransferase domain